MKRIWIIIFLLGLAACACNLPTFLSPQARASQTAIFETIAVASWTITPSATTTPTLTPSETPPPTLTETKTLTPTITLTPSVTLSPTYEYPLAVVNKQAHCRYGPHVAYLHAADLYAGDQGEIKYRFYLNGWVLVQFNKLTYPCWVAPSVIDVAGNIEKLAKFTLDDVERNLPGPSIYYKAPGDIVLTRHKNQLTITWGHVEMTKDKDRGYFLNLFVCQNKFLLWWPVSFEDQYTTSYTVQDEKGCNEPSYGTIYTVEKHGYSSPKSIPNWPTP